MRMTTSGLACAIHSLDFSKPENTRFQYGSSVCLLSIAAPIAGTWDDETPAMILATFCPRLAARLCFGFRRLLCRFLGRLFHRFGRLCYLARLAAIAFDRAAAGQHHVGVVVLARPGHRRGEMAERMAVGGAELCGEIDIAAELQHAVVIALEDGVGLLRRQVEFLEVFRPVPLEGLAVLALHQRPAKHVDAKSLARAVLVEHVGAGDVVVIVLFAGHRRISLWHHIYSAAKLGNVSGSVSNRS